MSYFGDYQRKAIQPGYVDQEGDYQVKITGVSNGEITSRDGDKKRYTQVKCLVNHKARPVISIFLTEGDGFDGNFTAFCDTFGLQATQDPSTWAGHTGWIHIMLTKKDGFTNMVPRWLLDDQGYVREEVRRAANQGTSQSQQQAPQVSYGDASDQDFGDIPF